MTPPPSTPATEVARTYHQLVQYTCDYNERLRTISCEPFLRTFMQIGEERTRFEVTKMVGSEVKRLHKRDFNAKVEIQEAPESEN